LNYLQKQQSTSGGVSVSDLKHFAVEEKRSPRPVDKREGVSNDCQQFGEQSTAMISKRK
jgi:hypothetical protein